MGGQGTLFPHWRIGYPHVADEARSQQTGQDTYIHLIVLDLRLGNQLGFVGIGDHHSACVRLQQVSYGPGIGSRLQKDLVTRPEVTLCPPRQIRHLHRGKRFMPSVYSVLTKAPTSTRMYIAGMAD